jgi:hypothetical protein
LRVVAFFSAKRRHDSAPSLKRHKTFPLPWQTKKRCGMPPSRVERVAPPTPLFISAATLQSFYAQQQLEEHTRAVRDHVPARLAAAGAHGGVASGAG